MSSYIWDAHLELFKEMKPPLRLHPSEIGLYQGMVDKLVLEGKISGLRVLILGITIELINLNWPKDTLLTVVDRSKFMIDHLWSGDISDRHKVVCANWLDMSFPKESFHLIMGDGAINFMSYPDGYQDLTQRLSELLTSKGQIYIRIFNQLDQKENPKEIVKEFNQSTSIDYFEFRFRFLTSLQEDVREGIQVTSQKIDEHLQQFGIELSELYKKSGYRPPKLPPITPSKADDNRISYPTDQEFSDLIGPYCHVERKLHGTHKLSHRTPIFVMMKK